MGQAPIRSLAHLAGESLHRRLRADTSTQGHEVDRNKGQATQGNDGVEHLISLAKESSQSYYKKSCQETLKTSGPKERPESWYRENNLIGTPQDVAEFLIDFKKAGATHVVPLHIAADTLSEIKDQLQLFAEEVMPLVRAD